MDREYGIAVWTLSSRIYTAIVSFLWRHPTCSGGQRVHCSRCGKSVISRMKEELSKRRCAAKCYWNHPNTYIGRME